MSPQLGSLVQFQHKSGFLPVPLIGLQDALIGIVTESWLDEDDTLAFIVNFLDTQWVFRQPNVSYLKVISHAS